MTEASASGSWVVALTNLPGRTAGMHPCMRHRQDASAATDDNPSEQCGKTSSHANGKAQRRRATEQRMQTERAIHSALE